MYKGIAENLTDVNNSISLISEIFFSKRDDDLLVPKDCMLRENIIIIKNHRNELIATCLIYPRTLFHNQENIKTCFLSYICVNEKYRKKNLARALMTTANNLTIKRGLRLSFVIARKSVDYFYNKFEFVGISNYSKITISQDSVLKDETLNDISFRNILVNDISFLNKTYEVEYEKLNGSFKRSNDHWKFVIKKSKNQKIKIKVILKKGDLIGYLIYKKRHIYEISLLNNNYLKVIKRIFMTNNYKNLIFEISKNHSLAKEIYKLDYTISERQCLHGGHMVRINDAEYFGIKETEMELVLKKNKTQRLHNQILKCLGLSKLNDSVKENSFNIPFVDHL